MNTIVKNIIAVIAGCIAGSAVNMSIIVVSSSIIPPPAGVDVSSTESLKESIHLFGPKNFIFPFLAHALGTFAGAFLAAFIAANHKLKIALVIGFFFLAGGIASVAMLPSPVWFTVFDLVAAYLPMAYAAGKLVMKKTGVDYSVPKSQI